MQLVHLGFLRAWRSVQHATEVLIRQAVGAQEDDQFRNCEWKTLFAGHSLGGALATLATASAVANGSVFHSSVNIYPYVMLYHAIVSCHAATCIAMVF